MKDFLKQFCTNALALILAAAIFVPNLVKTVHALYEHQELVCVDQSPVHVHEVEFDCDFQKYQLSPQLYPNFLNLEEIPSFFSKEKNENQYTFLSQYQKLHFTLRGPPSAS